MSQLIETGVRAPAFELKTATGDTFRLSDALGTSRPLLIFYPKDFTPGCTRQLEEMNANIEALAAASITPFGVNPGDAESHEKFEKSLGLTYPLLIDEGSGVSHAYGATKDDGKGIERSVVLIDINGVVVFAQRGAPGWDVILEALKSVS